MMRMIIANTEAAALVAITAIDLSLPTGVISGTDSHLMH
jgi:hypothetical protein